MKITVAHIESMRRALQRVIALAAPIGSNEEIETATLEVETLCDLALKGLTPPEGGRIEQLQMQIGYLATALMVRGYPFTLPEIVKEAEDACRPQGDSSK